MLSRYQTQIASLASSTLPFIRTVLTIIEVKLLYFLLNSLLFIMQVFVVSLSHIWVVVPSWSLKEDCMYLQKG